MGLGTSTNIQNFAPVQTKTLATTATTGRVTFDYTSPTVVTQLDANSAITSCMVTNDGTKTAFIKFGDSTVTATTSDTPILGGAIYVFDKGINLFAAGICGGSDSTTLYFTPGVGS